MLAVGLLLLYERSIQGLQCLNHWSLEETEKEVLAKGLCAFVSTLACQAPASILILARAGLALRESQDLSPLLLEQQGRAERAAGRDLLPVPHFWHPSPDSLYAFFGFKEGVGTMVTRQKRKHI